MNAGKSLKTYRTCFVPLCKNTTISTPEKVFATVPQNVKRRSQWFQSARRDYSNSRSNFFCCEDHFDLKEDMENYMYYSEMGGPVKIKQHVVPHKFECQPNRKRTNNTPRAVAEKRKRQHEINEMLLADTQPSSSGNSDNKLHPLMTLNTDLNESTIVVNAKTSPVENSEPSYNTVNLHASVQTQTENHEEQRDIGVQVNIRPKYRSAHIMCTMKPSVCNANCSPIKLYQFVNTATSPVKFPPRKILQLHSKKKSPSMSSNEIVSSNDYYEPHTDTSNSTYMPSPKKDIPNASKLTNYFISTNMKAYIGIPTDWAFLLDILSAKTNISTDNIKMCLTKIKRQDTFERLGEQFNISPSNAIIIFKKTIPVLAHMLKTFIYFPDPDTVKKNLPLAFRASYSHVQAIVDALEIQIEKPSDPLNQALTWSEYKKCNTVKCLISCSADGFINSISTGYGGRISDVLLFEKCGILDKLPTNCGVMADRGFKNIQSLLATINCQLIKPPSVSSSIKPTKSEVLQTKRIASLRIHVKRVIGRLREFHFLKPHAVINHNMIADVDDILIIAAALINLQSPIIKL